MIKNGLHGSTLILVPSVPWRSFPVWRVQRYPLLGLRWFLQLEIASKASNTRSADLEPAFRGLVR